jgi:hypothetical protein
MSCWRAGPAWQAWALKRSRRRQIQSHIFLPEKVFLKKFIEERNAKKKEKIKK